MKSLNQILVYFAVFLMVNLMITCAPVTEGNTVVFIGAPAVSPNGKWITFGLYVVGSDTVGLPSTGQYIMSIDGSEKNLLFRRQSTDGITGIWSPDGRQMATPNGIYTIKNNTVIDFRPINPAIGITDWSPDGKNILFYNFIGGNIFMCDTLFNNIRELPFKALFPRWMSDGKHILCNIPPTGQHNDVCIIDTLGVDTLHITHGIRGILSPVPSPDGNMIAYSRDNSIHVMNLDGSNHQWLDNGEYPAWTPDSKYIVYVSGNFESRYIMKISIDGTEKIQISNNLNVK